MGVPPEYAVEPELDHLSIPTGRYEWTVYDPVSSGPIKTGVAKDRVTAHINGQTARSLIEAQQEVY